MFGAAFKIRPHDAIITQMTARIVRARLAFSPLLFSQKAKKFSRAGRDIFLYRDVYGV
jgi:hypothetical protein